MVYFCACLSWSWTGAKAIFLNWIKLVPLVLCSWGRWLIPKVNCWLLFAEVSPKFLHAQSAQVSSDTPPPTPAFEGRICGSPLWVTECPLSLWWLPLPPHPPSCLVLWVDMEVDREVPGSSPAAQFKVPGSGAAGRRGLAYSSLF